MQSGAAIVNEAARLVIFGLKRRRVDRRVEGFSLPPLDHGFIVFAIGVFRFLDISFAQKHVGGGLIRIGSREPFGQREQLIGDPVCIAEFADLLCHASVLAQWCLIIQPIAGIRV